MTAAPSGYVEKKRELVVPPENAVSFTKGWVRHNMWSQNTRALSSPSPVMWVVRLTMSLSQQDVDIILGSVVGWRTCCSR